MIERISELLDSSNLPMISMFNIRQVWINKFYKEPDMVCIDFDTGSKK
jgi:hypothetical protein